MLMSGVVLAAAALAAGDPMLGARGELATWPVGKVSTIAGAGLNEEPMSEVAGRVWVGRPIIGGIETGDRAGSSAERYGAYDQKGMRVAVQIEPLFHFQSAMVGVINPFVQQNDRSMRRNPYGNPFQDAQDRVADRLEDARQQWLKDNGYVGGVRTHVNDANLWKKDAKAQSSSEQIVPRATIQMNPDAPKRSGSFRVDAGSRVPKSAVEKVATSEPVQQRISAPWTLKSPVPAVQVAQAETK